MPPNHLPRDNVSHSRRTFLGTSGLAAFIALVVQACGAHGGSTAESSSASSPTTASPTGDATTTTHGASHAGSTAAAQTSSTAAGSPTTLAAPATAGAAADAIELRVAFTYVADTEAGGGQPPPGGGGKQGGGRGGLKNPYVAVWIEDAKGNDVRPVSLFYQEREARYLNELRRFTKAETARKSAGGKDLIATYSSPTRQPGTYDIVWDGKDADGQALAAGSYFLCIESSREHGPYSLIREPISLGGATTDLTLADQGELKNASVKFVQKA
jgi:hypothetical protein